MDRRFFLGGLGATPLLAQCATPPAQPASGAYATEVEHLRFANGMQAVLARTPPSTETPRVFVGLYVRYGAAAEARPELAHLVEHVAANNALVLQDFTIGEDITVLGSNAMTRMDYSSLWRVVSPNGVDAFIGNRANRVVGLNNDPTIFAREVPRVSGELERAVAAEQQNGPDVVALLARAFRPAAPTTAERIPLVRGYTGADAFAEIEAFYRPGNAVLVVAGDVDMDAARASLQRRLAAYPPREGRSGTPAPDFPAYAGPIVTRSAQVQQARLAVGLPAPPRRSRDFLAYLIADHVLLGGRAEATPSQMRRSDEAALPRRLAASIGANSFGDAMRYVESPPPLAQVSPHYLTVTCATSATDVVIVERALQAAFSDIAATITDAEIEQAKAALLAFLSNWMLSPTLLALADHLAAFALIDADATRLNRLPRELAAIRPREVRRLLAGYAEPRRPRLALVLPA